MIEWRSSWVVQGRAVGEGSSGELVPVRVGVVRTAVGDRFACQIGDGKTVILTDEGASRLIAHAREALAEKIQADPR